jgi:hypothetical protein
MISKILDHIIKNLRYMSYYMYILVIDLAL